MSEMVDVMVLRAEGEGLWREAGVFAVSAELEHAERRRAALDAAADAADSRDLEAGVAFVAAEDWLPVTVRESLQPARVFEGL